jgi:hypothetical protein
MSYEKTFEPYQRKNYPLPRVIDWLKKTSKAKQDVIDLVVSETMGMISQGFDFSGQCECGCNFEVENYPDAKISHYMLARTFELTKTIETNRLKILEQVENTKLEARMKQLSNFEKEYFIMKHGKWYQRFWHWLTTYEGIR